MGELVLFISKNTLPYESESPDCKPSPSAHPEATLTSTENPNVQTVTLSCLTSTIQKLL